jgi:hypothetical protein
LRYPCIFPSEAEIAVLIASILGAHRSDEI